MQERDDGEQEKTEVDFGLKSKFLQGLDGDAKLHIFDLTTRASRELHRWAARYPLIRRNRVWPLSLSVAAAAPFASVRALVSMSRMNLWVFTIDDLFDEEIVPFPELRRRVLRYHEILAGARVEPAQERDTLVLALQDIRDDLSTYPQFPALRDHWAEAVARTLDAMMREHDWRSLYHARDAQGALPTYDAYLAYGLYSVGGPPHILTTMIAISDPTTLEHIERLQEMARHASICIRLANDLQSYAKEILEGKINSIIILQQEAIAAGWSAEAALAGACERVRQDIWRGLARLTELQAQASTVTGHPDRAIADIARFVCDFYVHHDYHTFATGTGHT